MSVPNDSSMHIDPLINNGSVDSPPVEASNSNNTTSLHPKFDKLILSEEHHKPLTVMTAMSSSSLGGVMLTPSNIHNNNISSQHLATSQASGTNDSMNTQLQRRRRQQLINQLQRRRQQQLINQLQRRRQQQYTQHLQQKQQQRVQQLQQEQQQRVQQLQQEQQPIQVQAHQLQSQQALLQQQYLQQQYLQHQQQLMSQRSTMGTGRTAIQGYNIATGMSHQKKQEDRMLQLEQELGQMKQQFSVMKEEMARQQEELSELKQQQPQQPQTQMKQDPDSCSMSYVFI